MSTGSRTQTFTPADQVSSGSTDFTAYTKSSGNLSESLSLTVLYHGCHLTLPWAFGATLAASMPATLAVLGWGGLPRRRRRDWVVGLAVLLGVTAGTVRLVQESAQKAWDTGTPFRELLAQSLAGTVALDLDEVFDPSAYLRHTDEIFERRGIFIEA